MQTLNSQRDSSIDLLRSFALIGIMLVHVEPPPLIEQIRDFDVPMMVFLSGVVYAMTSSGVREGYAKFVWKRFVRLIVPTWVFLTIVVLLSIILKRPMRKETIVSLYTLQTQWYVWIIRVFFFIAIVSPLIGKWVSKTNKWFVLLALVLLVSITELIQGVSDNYTYKLFCIQIPYFAIFGLGCGINKFTMKECFATSLVCLIGYVIYALILYSLSGSYVLTGVQKYPPRTYYLLYSLGTVLLLWRVRMHLSSWFDKIHLLGLLSFVGSHSLWIYFYHIIGLLLIGSFYFPFWLAFILVFTLSLLLTFFQCYVIELITASIQNEKVKKYLIIIFKS